MVFSTVHNTACLRVNHTESRSVTALSLGISLQFYNGPDSTLGSRPTHIRLYAPADRRRIDMRPSPI